jgi:DNA-binding transcriptional LysR family regulator
MAEHEWLGFDGGLSRLRQSIKIAEHIPQDAIRLRFDSFGALHAAVRSGLGCAILPCFAGDADPQLLRLPNSLEQTALQLWVLTHPDLRRSARVRAFLQFFGTRLQRAADQLSGLPDPSSAAAEGPSSRKQRRAPLPA